MLTYYFRTVKDDGLKEVSEPRSGVWGHAIAPDEAELSTLAAAFALDVDLLKDAQDLYEVPRLERSLGATYFFTRYPLSSEGGEEGSDTAPLLIVMGESFVLTVAMTAVPPLSKLIAGEVEVFTTQKNQAFHPDNGRIDESVRRGAYALA